MNSISSDIVEKTWKKVGGMSPLEGQKLIFQMKDDQPFVLAYLMGVGGETLNQAERELLLYLGTVVWQIMKQGDIALPKISPDTLDEHEEKNIKMLEYLEGESEIGFIETTKKILENYNQPQVLRYVFEAIMEEEDKDEEEEERFIRDENKGIMIIFLKTIIDCLDK